MDTDLYPIDVVDQRLSGILCIRWSDGGESRLSHERLRQACRCASCEQQRRDGTLQAVAPSVRLTDIHAVADKALNLVFSDGHDRGIYPWAYLRALDAAAD